VPLDISREISSASGRVVPGGTLLLPATATTTHSTTMSDSASEVSVGATKTVSTRRNPLLVGGAISAVALVIVLVFVLTPGSSPKPSRPVVAVAPVTAPVGRPTSPAPETPPGPASAPTAAPTENPTVETAAVKQDDTPRAEPEPKQVEIEVDSDPTGAEVWLPDDSQARGHTPFKVVLDRRAAPARVILKARGYADKTLKLNPTKPDPVSVTLERISRDHDTGGKKKAPTTLTGGKKDSSGYKPMGD
jgi:cytoskeletal protein RodZ